MRNKCLNSGYKEVRTIYPGEFTTARLEQGVVIHTLLGSCIAACLYDEQNHIFGMNHFMLACEHYSNSVQKSAKYGVHAMELLINDMVAKGAGRYNLKAKVFGGASPLRSMKSSTVGADNIDFILKFLEMESIPLISSNVGGEYGRVIYFMPDDYTVYMKKIVSKHTEKLLLEEAAKCASAVRSYDDISTKKSEIWGTVG